MDIDIDISPKTNVDKLFNLIHASQIQANDIKKHLVGVYFQNIPIDNITGLAAIPYKEAEKLGYYKIDMLHLNLLSKFTSKKEIRDLLKKEPDWKQLEEREVVEKLFHISNHFDMVYKIKPKNVQELADILALIRPGKINLFNKYMKDKKSTREELYTKRNRSDLRKSHAISYALLIILQLNLLNMESEFI